MNKRGVALILSYAVILVLTILASAFLSSIISENNLVRRYEASSQAFWIAEAGLANAYHTWSANRAYPGEANTPLGEGTYTVTKTPLNPQVTVTGTVGTTQRTIHAQFVGIPRAFDNVLSVGGDLAIAAGGTNVPSLTVINGNIRYSGQYHYYVPHNVTSFSSLPQQAGQNLTTIRIPDYTGDGGDTFNDFVQFGRQVIASYPPEQTIYIKTDGLVVIDPGWGSNDFLPGGYYSVQGKKVVFIEGSNPNKGSLFLMSYGVPKTQDVTIITTGSILSIFGTSYPANSRINTISWGPYQDWAVWNTQDSLSVNGVHYSHNNMLLENDSVYTSFMSTSNYICNGNMELLNWDQCHVTYNYSPRSANGDLPPGFEFLGTDNGTPKLIKWSE